MSDHHQLKFSAIELDLDLLSTPFKLETNWHVITGTPSSGKTTLINQLAESGYRIVPETARLYIQQEMAKEQGIHPMHSDPAALQRKIKDLQLSVERGLEADDFLFLDGAVPGSLAYYRVCGLNPNELLPECFHHRYASVFLLDPLPFQVDDERVEEVGAVADFLDEWHTRDFRSLGYDIVRVPGVPPQERLAFVLESLSERGLI